MAIVTEKVGSIRTAAATSSAFLALALLINQHPTIRGNHTMWHTFLPIPLHGNFGNCGPVA
jgi:hypothetical protein